MIPAVFPCRNCNSEPSQKKAVSCKFIGAKLLPYSPVNSADFLFFFSNGVEKLCRIDGPIEMSFIDSCVQALTSQYGNARVAQPLNAVGEVHYLWVIGDDRIEVGNDPDMPSVQARLSFTRQPEFEAYRNYQSAIERTKVDKQNQLIAKFWQLKSGDMPPSIALPKYLANPGSVDTSDRYIFENKIKFVINRELAHQSLPGNLETIKLPLFS